MSDKLKNAYYAIADIIDTEIAPIFKLGTLFTVIARTPGNEQADVLVSNDRICDIEELLERSKAREDYIP